jgi:hypothetical protein
MISPDSPSLLEFMDRKVFCLHLQKRNMSTLATVKVGI